ncbi:MAG: hypothetical protein LC112_05210 [Flavobacteriales bacterium]|nr:hypothetical protein [Flavobacteriales bacterium]
MIKLNKIPHDQINTYGGRCKINHKTEMIIREYIANKVDCNSGLFKLEISDVYKHDNIKDKLKDAQKNKCAFCEVNLDSQHGEVEHFRPKKMYKQNPEDSEHFPGYYWLSYNYENLLLSCISCNQKWKKNLFPIKRPDRRAIDHNFNILKEKPYFLNPYKDIPSKFIKFVGPLATGVDKCNRGKLSIKYFSLNRKGESGINSIYELRKSLYDKLNVIRESLNFVPVSDPLFVRLTENIENAKSESEEYSAMVKDNF